MVQVINMEWGNFDSELLPRCFADVEVDPECLNQGEQVTANLLCAELASSCDPQIASEVFSPLRFPLVAAVQCRVGYPLTRQGNRWVRADF